MNLPLAPLAAGVLGALAALAVAAMPASALEGLVMDSGLPAVIAAAEPPLGLTARAALALATGGLVAMFCWLGLFVLLGTRGVTIGAEGRDAPSSVEAPVLRRADAHPDAPPRPPLLATRDLGTPFLEVRAGEAAPAPEAVTPEPEPAPAPAPAPAAAKSPPVEQALPQDFDQPLAAFDPDAILDRPLPPPVTLRPLRQPRPPVYNKNERFEVFELTPMRRPAPPPPSVGCEAEPIARAETEASVHALLDRLERGVVRKGLASGVESDPRPRDAERGLEDALVSLRNLARRA